jgi:hypothetical protein
MFEHDYIGRALEVFGVIEHEEDIYRVAKGERADYYSVYIINEEGLSDCIDDFDSREAAMTYAYSIGIKHDIKVRVHC